MSIFDRDFSQIDAAVVAGGSAAMIRNVLQAALDEIALLRKERGALVAALKATVDHIGNGYQPPDLIDQAYAALKLPGEA